MSVPGPPIRRYSRPILPRHADPEAERLTYENAQVHGRLVTAEEIADAIVYLASPRAASTIGAALVVDGGYSIR